MAIASGADKPDSPAPPESTPESAPESTPAPSPVPPPVQPPQFQQAPPPYPPPYQAPFPPQGYPPYRQPSRWNGWAIAGFVCSFFVHVLGLVFGLIALNELNRSGQRGRGLAIAGIAIGASLMVLAIAGGIAGWSSFREIIGPIGR